MRTGLFFFFFLGHFTDFLSLSQSDHDYLHFYKLAFIIFKIFIGVYLIYNVVLVSAAQQSESVIYTYIYVCVYIYIYIYIYLYMYLHS